MIESNGTPSPEPAASASEAAAPAAFCQNCGKPLDKEAVRAVGSSVFCEPCLAARIHGSASPFAANNWVSSAWPPSGLAPTTPNPGLATLLGFIPGVGAMYNEQYGKGLVHLIVFAILVSLVDANGIFLVFVFGWVAYMAFEAHHTAQARRDGTPLPNPFGLNDIGERMGFGRAWPGAARAGAPSGGPFAAGPAAQTTAPGWNAGPSSAPPPAQETAGWGAPVDQYPYAAPSAQGSAFTPVAAAPPPDFAPYTRDYRSAASGYGAIPSGTPRETASAPFGYGPYTAPPYNATYVPPVPGDVGYVAPPSRFPAGAVWLIGLGTLFLLTTTGIFSGFPGGILVGFLLIGLGVWVFLRRMFESGPGLAADGTPQYGLRVVRAVRGAVWLMLLGVLLLLNDFHVLGWHRSWPLFIIVAGVMALLERAAWTSASAPYAPPPSAVPTPDASTAATSFIPQHDAPGAAATEQEKGGS